MNEKNLNKTKNENFVINSHLKENGFINQSAEIYDGFSKFWDFGVNGSLLKNNIKKAWLDFFVNCEEKNFLIENPILTHEKVLESSGHKKNFNDWITECINCKRKFRIDKILEEKENTKFFLLNNKEKKGFSLNTKCSDCKGELKNPEEFNLMLKTEILSKKKDYFYLRPETCQGIFINFKNITKTLKKEIPFGVAQIGKSFRNEITLNHGIFRMREFEQAELEFFSNEKNKEWWWNYWNERSCIFFERLIMQKKDHLKKVFIQDSELPHYSLKTTDLYFNYKFGWGEFCSISDRGDYDLKNHSEKSSTFLGTKKDSKEFSHVIETSFGVERIFLAVLESSYEEEMIKKTGLIRKYLKIHPLLSPYFVSVMPLSKQLKKKAKEVYKDLMKLNLFSISYEETGNIGNRYRRQDSIGTKFCITIDFETDKSYDVTIRERDSMNQERIKINKLEKYLLDFLNEEKKSFVR